MLVLQQGDILLKLAQGREWIGYFGNFTQVKDGRCILAKGETSGHSHVAIGNNLMVLEPRILEHVSEETLTRNCFLLASDKPFTVQHPEHDEIIVPAGTWSVEKVKEYDHFAEGTTEVKD